MSLISVEIDSKVNELLPKQMLLKNLKMTVMIQ